MMKERAMADPVSEFQAIVDTRNDAFKQLSEVEAPALAKFNDLVNKKNTGQTLSADEQNQLQVARSTLDTVHHAMWIVGQVSLQAMNDSALLRDIKNSLKAVSADLEDTVNRLKRIAAVAATAASVAATVAALAEKLPKPV